MAADSAGVQAWREELSTLEARLGELFVRAEPRRQAGLYLEGLLSAAKRKNGWQLAEQIGDARPWRTQRVLGHVLWDQDAARDLCRDYVLEHLGAADGVLIVDETGFLKKGGHSVGVARQYCGQLGEQENCRVAVSPSVANDHASLPIAYRLYLPEAWAEDPVRRAKAGVPEEVGFETKTAIALGQLRRAREAGIPAGIVLGDAAYGDECDFRVGVAELELPYVLGLRGAASVWPPGQAPLPPAPWSGQGRPPTRLRRSPEHGRIIPLGLRDHVVHRLVLGLHAARLDPGGHRLDALALAGQEQAGRVGPQRRAPVRVAQHVA